MTDFRKTKTKKEEEEKEEEKERERNVPHHLLLSSPPFSPSISAEGSKSSRQTYRKGLKDKNPFTLFTLFFF